MKPYAKTNKGTDTKGWKSFSGPHPNRKNKIRVDKKSARQEVKKIVEEGLKQAKKRKFVQSPE